MWDVLYNYAARNQHQGLGLERQPPPQRRGERKGPQLHLVTELRDQRGLPLFGKSIQVFCQQVFTEHFLGALPLPNTGDKVSK